MTKYLEIKRQIQEEYNNFPFMWAFSNKQFKEGMKKLGLKPTDTDKIISIGAGGYMRKSDIQAFKDMTKRCKDLKNKAIAEDVTGDGYIYEMFYHELANHEYCYSRDIDTVLEACGLTMDEIEQSPSLTHGLTKALSKYNKDTIDY